MKPLSGTEMRTLLDEWCYLKDGSIVIITQVDETNGMLRYIEDGREYSDRPVIHCLAYSSFYELLDEEETPEEVCSIIKKLANEYEPFVDELVLYPVELSEADVKRREALYRPSVVTEDALSVDGYVYLIEGKRYSIAYQERIDNQYLSVFEPFPIPVFEAKENPRVLFSECLRLALRPEAKVFVSVGNAIRKERKADVLSTYLPLCEEYASREILEANQEGEGLARKNKVLANLLSELAPFELLSEDAATPFLSLAETELKRRSKTYVERGRWLFDRGYVRDLRTKEGKVIALVLSSDGNKVYSITVTINSRGKLELDCNCPYGKDHSYCKHSLAVLFAMLDLFGRYRSPQEEQLDLIRSAIAGIDIYDYHGDYEDEEDWD